ncbi:hypothetical protein QEH54_17025 [Pelagicoccus sp. SDUM812003]|nr:hypothetical protein [Pelagicoccus sp. SDUM812003]MDQ8204730.1 hypothetical protein [Pelagicoccus sp. SDUM812003]
MAALGGAALGATAGGITGGLIGLGIPELEAKQYEGKVKAGNILLSVHTEDSDEIDRAKDIFKSAGAEDISTTGESSVPGHDEPDGSDVAQSSSSPEPSVSTAPKYS